MISKQNLEVDTGAQIIREIKENEHLFRKCEFIFEGRDSNKEAHSLAKYSAFLHQGRHMWLVAPHDPFCISVNILNDQ